MLYLQYFASWVRYRSQDRLGQRGAEMVEYAIVIACIAAVGIYFYATGKPKNTSHMKLTVILSELWEKINEVVEVIPK